MRIVQLYQLMQGVAVCGLLASTSLLGGPASAADRMQKLASRDWSADSGASDLRQNPPTLAEVDNFVKEQLDLPKLAGAGKACSFTFAKLTAEKNYQLIVSYDAGGGSCNSVLVFSKKGKVFTSDEVGSWNVSDAAALIQDVDKNDSRELVVPTVISSLGGIDCVGTWPKIYRLADGKLEDESADHTAFYKERLTAKEAAASKAKKSPSLFAKETMAGTSEATCAEMEIGKIARLAGEKNAGFDVAVRWMRSDDSTLRQKAAIVFADIGTKEAAMNLAVLARDADPSVAEAARSMGLTKDE